MSTTATPETTASDWRVWLPGIVTPVACLVIDRLLREPVSRFAPAGVLAVALIGIGCIVLTRYRRQGPLALGAGGALWVVGGLTAALGLLLALPFALGLIAFVGATLANPHARQLGLPLVLLILALLGFSPLWTGIVYIREASALTRAPAEIAPGSPVELAGPAAWGVLAALLTVAAAQVADSAFIATRLAALDRETPATWDATFQSLAAYPLCGHRCQLRVCEHLLETRSDGRGDLNVPLALDEAFQRTYGVSATSFCSSPL